MNYQCIIVITLHTLWYILWYITWTIWHIKLISYVLLYDRIVMSIKVKQLNIWLYLKYKNLIITQNGIYNFYHINHDMIIY